MSRRRIWTSEGGRAGENERRRRAYLGERPPIELSPGGRPSSSMTASPPAPRCWRPCGRPGGAQPAHLVLAVPVAPPDTLDRMRREVDEALCLDDARRVLRGRPVLSPLPATRDAEVIALLEQARGFAAAAPL